jgi:putative transposase
LYPGNALKEDAHYFRRKEYDTEGENGPSTRAEWVRQKEITPTRPLPARGVKRHC